MNGPPRDDSTFPLNFADYENDNQPHFYGDGQTFIIQWSDRNARPSDAGAERRRRGASWSAIRFEHWQVGDQRNGWTAVGEILPASSAGVDVRGDGRWGELPRDHVVRSSHPYSGPRRVRARDPASRCVQPVLRGSPATTGRAETGTSRGAHNRATTRDSMCGCRDIPRCVPGDGQLLVQLP